MEPTSPPPTSVPVAEAVQAAPPSPPSAATAAAEAATPPTGKEAVVVKVPTVEMLPTKGIWATIWSDIHVNGSGLFMFACGTAAIFFPEYKDKLNELTVLAGTYLFASSKAKN
jgi:hypothetical protein